jgi:hypothetical protein
VRSKQVSSLSPRFADSSKTHSHVAWHPQPGSNSGAGPRLVGIDAIAAGHRHCLALAADTGNLCAWGHNGSGQVGNGSLLDVGIPVVVLTGVSTMDAGDGFSLAAKSNGTLKESLANAIVATIDVNSATVTVNNAVVSIALPVNLENGTSYYVEIDPGAWNDFSGNAFGGIAGSRIWRFTTPPMGERGLPGRAAAWMKISQVGE